MSCELDRISDTMTSVLIFSQMIGNNSWVGNYHERRAWMLPSRIVGKCCRRNGRRWRRKRGKAKAVFSTTNECARWLVWKHPLHKTRTDNLNDYSSIQWENREWSSTWEAEERGISRREWTSVRRQGCVQYHKVIKWCRGWESDCGDWVAEWWCSGCGSRLDGRTVELMEKAKRWSNRRIVKTKCIEVVKPLAFEASIVNTTMLFWRVKQKYFFIHS